MRSWIAKSQELLETPVGLTPRALLLGAVLLLLPSYVSSLYDMTMFAPQYPDGLRLHIYSYKLEGGNAGQDLKEINVLNHYIGMRDLAADDFSEFKWIPFVVGGLGLALPARGGAREALGHRGRLRALPLLRSVLPLVLRLQDVLVRPPSLPDGRGQGRALHAAALRLQASSRTSRSTPTPASAPTPSPAWRPLLAAALYVDVAAEAEAAGDRHPDVARLGPLWSQGWLRGASPGQGLASPGTGPARGPAGRAGPLAAAGAHRRGGARRDVARRRRGRTAAISSSIAPCGSWGADGHARGFRRRQRRPHPCRRRHHRGLRHRRPPRGRPRPRLLGDPRRRAPRDGSRLPDPRRDVRRVPARGPRDDRRGLRHPRDPRQGSGREGLGHPRLEHDGFELDGNDIADVRDGFYIQSSTKGRIRRNAARDLRYGLHLHVLRRQRLRGQPVRERRGRRRAHVLEAHHLPPQPIPPQPRVRLGGAAVQGVRRRRRRGQPDRRQRPRHLPRGLVSRRLPAQRGGAVGRGDRPLRLVGRQPLRGQLVRRQLDAAQPRRPPDRHRLRGQLLVRKQRAGPRRRRPERPAVPPDQRLRPLPRQPDGRRPDVPGGRGRGAGRRRGDVPRAPAVPVEDRAPLARPPVLARRAASRRAKALRRMPAAC